MRVSFIFSEIKINFNQFSQEFQNAPLRDFIYPTPMDSIASIIDLSSQSVRKTPYNELICLEEDKEKISFLIMTMSGNDKWTLLRRAFQLLRLKEELFHVHPLRFLGVIFSNPILKDGLRKMHGVYFKRREFVGGLEKRMNSEADQDNLNCYLNDFSKEINIPLQVLQPYVESRNWEGFIKACLQ